MVNPKVSTRPTICYRPIRASDLDILERIHINLFPIRYESTFFQDVVHGRDIVSWGAVDRNRPDGRSDELIGFVTARIVLARESEIVDMIGCESSKADQTLVYILTLGVVETYRNLGIASSLIREVMKYSSSIPTCRAVYLHVISYNNPAIYLYKKMSFKCLRRLQGFYLINGQHYDSYLFLYYVNGGRSPCSPVELLTAMINYVRSGFKSVTARLVYKNQDMKTTMSRWAPKCKENHSLVTPATHNKRNHARDSTPTPTASDYDCV